MTTFSPTSRLLEPIDRPDALSDAVLQSLCRPIGKKPWGVVRTIVLGGISFGLLPLLFWTRRFRFFAFLEQQQFWHLAEWLRLRSIDPRAKLLRDETERLKPEPIGLFIPLICIAIAVMQFLPWLRDSWFGLDQLIAVTYGHNHGPFSIAMPTWHDAHRLFKVWTLTLAIGYGVHWLHVRRHAIQVRRWVEKFNELLTREGAAAVPLPRIEMGLRAKWVAGAVLGIFANAIWAIPAMLAGGLQERYTRTTSDQLRSAIGLRVRGLLLAQRPAVNVPLPVRLRAACVNDRCRASLPSSANFCPRCGSRALVGVNAVA